MTRSDNRVTDMPELSLYPKRNLTIIRGAGATLWDEDGHTYIDCIGGHGVAIVGHSHPLLVRAIHDQSKRLIVCPGTLDNDMRTHYISRLTDITPEGLDYVFLANSGTEAIEAAIKFARVTTGRTKLVATMRGFHGRTMGALSLTWKKAYRQPFEPLVPDIVHIPYGNIDAARSIVDEHTAAIIVEPIQGEGGVRPAPEGYLQSLRKLCDATGALLIVDEVQTGFGRTGAMFAIEHWDVIPDILCLAKGIAGGIPMGAVITNERVASILRPGHHGSTFGGNPLACAAALAVLHIIQSENLVERAREKSQWLFEQLARLPSQRVREVRGMGLMVGIELRERATPYLQRLQEEHHILALPAGPNVIRLLPPLVITGKELARVVDALYKVLS